MACQTNDVCECAEHEMPHEPKENAAEAQMEVPKKVSVIDALNIDSKYLGKKFKMRTAADVISRILWDTDLPSQYFTVGYLDRFVGLVEKAFDFFSWEDLATVDNTVLAIPQHRIVYFKYRHVKVWDKNQRMDLVFRSTHINVPDIHELLRMIEEEHELLVVSEAKSADLSEDEDDDIDSEIDVNLGAGNFYLQEKYEKDRPNFFVAVRVTDPQVVDKVKMVKEHILSKEPLLHEIMIPDEALHITLATLKLDDLTEIATASRAMQSFKWNLEEKIVMNLKGMLTFNGQVLYVGVEAPDAFYDLHKALLSHLNSCGVQLLHAFDFVPHMTILKMTRSRTKILKNPYVDPFLYVEFKDTEFGQQTYDNLHLCEIGREKRFDGFYTCSTEVHFS